MGQCMAICSGGDEQQKAPQQQQHQQQQQQQGGQKQPHQQPQSQPQHQQAHRNNTAGPHGGKAGGGAPSFGGPREFPPSSSAGDAQRFEAGVHAKRRGDLLAQSQTAWDKGDKAAAKRLSDEGKAEGAAMERCNAAAAAAYFADNNKNHGPDTIDLHGLYTAEAVDALEKRLRVCQQQRLPQLVVIVGMGNHSKDNVRKIKPAVEKLIREHKLRVAVDRFVDTQPCNKMHFGVRALLAAFPSLSLSLARACCIDGARVVSD